MAKQTIGIGTVANDGTGDPLRTAMDKVNDNFDELYTITENAQTVNAYTLVLADNMKLITMSYATANTVTVPPYTGVAFPVGSFVVVTSIGAGQTSIAAGVGVTINSADSALKLRVQFSTATLTKTATNTWLLTGDIEA